MLCIISVYILYNIIYIIYTAYEDYIHDISWYLTHPYVCVCLSLSLSVSVCNCLRTQTQSLASCSVMFCSQCKPTGARVSMLFQSPLPSQQCPTTYSLHYLTPQETTMLGTSKTTTTYDHPLFGPHDWASAHHARGFPTSPKLWRATNRCSLHHLLIMGMCPVGTLAYLKSFKMVHVAGENHLII